jgi:membrane protein DedA with SNARE-associated domain/rhodanese-related sulfurtransferase
MNEPTQFLIDHGGPVLFAAVFIEQIGLPLPSVPWLLAAGALAAGGKMSSPMALAVTVAACLVADLIWYYLGKRGGSRVLNFLCRISLEPDSCVRRTENLFEKHGMTSVAASKFLPGLGTVIPPMAGAFGIPLGKFIFWDAVGAVIYGVFFLGLGYMFSDQLEKIGGWLARMGGWGLAVVVALAVIYIGFKYLERQRVLRKLRMARVTPEEVFKKQEAGESLYILDLRSTAALKEDPTVLRGAVYMNVGDVPQRYKEIPRDRDVVVYCSCPNEVTAAKVALLLQKKGIARVRPLLGGIDGWRERNYPVMTLTVGDEPVELKI